MDLNVIADAPENLRVVLHNNPAHKPHLRARYAVAADQEILSGQIVSVKKNVADSRLEFIRGLDVDTDGAGAGDSALSLGNLIYVAIQASADGDVLNSGKLTGLSSAGGFELSTAHYDASKNYAAGDLLVPDGLTGKFIPVPADTAGFTVNGGQPIDTFVIARVVHDFAPPVNFAPVYTPTAGTPNGVSPGVTGEEFQVGRRFGAKNLTMLRIELLPPQAVTIAAP